MLLTAFAKLVARAAAAGEPEGPLHKRARAFAFPSPSADQSELETVESKNVFLVYGLEFGELGPNSKLSNQKRARN